MNVKEIDTAREQGATASISIVQQHIPLPSHS